VQETFDLQLQATRLVPCIVQPAVDEDRDLCGFSELKLGENTSEIQNNFTRCYYRMFQYILMPPQLRYDYFLLCKSWVGEPIPSYWNV